MGTVGYCPACAGPVLSVEEAMTAAAVSSRVLHRLVEADTVHFAEAPGGALLVCLNSLMLAVDNSWHEQGESRMRTRKHSSDSLE